MHETKNIFLCISTNICCWVYFIFNVDLFNKSACHVQCSDHHNLFASGFCYRVKTGNGSFQFCPFFAPFVAFNIWLSFFLKKNMGDKWLYKIFYTTNILFEMFFYSVYFYLFFVVIYFVSQTRFYLTTRWQKKKENLSEIIKKN